MSNYISRTITITQPMSLQPGDRVRIVDQALEVSVKPEYRDLGIREMGHMLQDMQRELREMRIAAAPVVRGPSEYLAEAAAEGVLAEVEKVMAGDEPKALAPVDPETLPLPKGRKKRMKRTGPSFAALKTLSEAGEKGLLLSEYITKNFGDPTDPLILATFLKPLTYLVSEELVMYMGSRSALTRRYFITEKGEQLYRA